MSRIESARPRSANAAYLVGGASSAARPSGSAFRVDEEAGTEAAVPLNDVASVSLGVMLAAEALDRDAERDQDARRQGHTVLSGLTELQRALLQGGDPAVALERLGLLIADMPVASDPRLAALVGTIVLRARVELARLQAPGGKDTGGKHGGQARGASTGAGTGGPAAAARATK